MADYTLTSEVSIGLESVGAAAAAIADSPLLDLAVEQEGSLVSDLNWSPEQNLALEQTGSPTATQTFTGEIEITDVDIPFATADRAWSPEVETAVEIAGGWETPLSIVGVIDADVEQLLTTDLDLSSLYTINPELEAGFIVERPTEIAPIDVAVELDETVAIGQVGTLDLAPEFEGTPDIEPEISGTIDVQVIPSASLVSSSVNREITREDRYEEDGIRPSFPIYVFAMDVRQQVDIDAVPIGQFFVLSTLYNRFDDDAYFYENGGGEPGMIGQRVQLYEADGVTPAGVTTLFRSPQRAEVVCFVGSLTLFRWERSQTWQEYYSMPERALAGNPAFTILDPDQIYAYYARVIGAAQAQWAYDNEILFSFYDPRLCPEPLLIPLGKQYGLQLSEGESEAQRRAKIELAVPTFKAKGLDEAVERRLIALGYRGCVWEVWIDPNHPELFTNDPNNSMATYRWAYDPDLTAYPVATNSGTVIAIDGDVETEWENLRYLLVRDGSQGSGEGRLFFIKEVGSFSGSTTPVEVTPAPTEDLTGMTAIPAMPGYVTRPHAMTRDIPIRYWPSSRLVVHVTYADGTPIDETPEDFEETFPGSSLEDFWSFLADQLYDDVIPLHTDIKFFGTSLGDSRENGDEVVGVQEFFDVNSGGEAIYGAIDVGVEIEGDLIDEEGNVITGTVDAPIEITATMPAGTVDMNPDFIGEWNMQEGSGTSAANTVPTGEPFTQQGATPWAWNADPEGGIVLPAGARGQSPITGGFGTTIDEDGPFTFCGWIKWDWPLIPSTFTNELATGITTTPNNSVLADGYRLRLYRDPSPLHWVVIPEIMGSSTPITMGAHHLDTPDYGNWIFVGFGWERLNKVNSWINGEYGEFPVGLLSNFAGFFSLGGNYQGTIDGPDNLRVLRWRVYDRLLTETQFQQVANYQSQFI